MDKFLILSFVFVSWLDRIHPSNPSLGNGNLGNSNTTSCGERGSIINQTSPYGYCRCVYSRHGHGIYHIAHPHFTGAGYQRTISPTRANFRTGLVSESHWLQPLLVLTVHWWPGTSKCGWGNSLCLMSHGFMQVGQE